MIRKKRYSLFNPLLSIASTVDRLFPILLVAAILMAGLGQEARGNTETTPNADALAAKEILNYAQKEAAPKTESASGPLSEGSLVIPSPEVAEWIERFEKLSNGIQIGRLDQKPADLFYKELNAGLTETRNRLRDALTALDTPVPQPAKIPPEKGANHSSEKNTEPENTKGVSPPNKAAEDRDRAFVIAQHLLVDLRVLYHLRLQTLELVSVELRDQVTGTGPNGVQALKEELDYLGLRSRYRIKLIPQIGKQIIDKIMGAPIPALFAFIQFVLSILIFIWWRRWAVEGITRVRRNILNIRPLKPKHKRLARFLWYLNRLRNPLGWYILFYFIWRIIGTPDGIFSILLWTQVKYILLAWFVVILIDAMTARGAAGLKSETARLRLRSLWLVTLWILFAYLGMDLTKELVGKGAIHAWFWTLSKILIVPVLFLLIHWWRQEIYRKLERESLQPNYIKKVLQHKRGIGSYLGSAIGAAYLIWDIIRQRLLSGMSAFDWGRHLIANLTRIEAVRISERRRSQQYGDPIPGEMRSRLYRCEGSLVESAGINILDQMFHLVKQRRRGNAVIVAERGGGKTQLLERLDSRLEEQMILLDCPPGGINSFYQVFAEALHLDASDLTPEVFTKRLQNRQVRAVGIDNLHRLSRPAMGGQHEIERLSELIREIEADVYWFYGVDWAAWQYISRVRADRLFVDDVLKLPLWTENQIRELIEQRSLHAGIQPDFGDLILPRQFVGLDHETLEDRNRFGFYRILWNAADGNPVVALQLWADSLRITPDGKIFVLLPKLPATEELESANITVLLILRVIAQSGYASQEQIIDSLKFPGKEIKVALRFALAREWLELDDGWYRVTWKWFRSITRVLTRQNFLVRKTLGG